jgi:hypothetical protein
MSSTSVRLRTKLLARNIFCLGPGHRQGRCYVAATTVSRRAAFLRQADRLPIHAPGEVPIWDCAAKTPGATQVYTVVVLSGNTAFFPEVLQAISAR